MSNSTNTQIAVVRLAHDDSYAVYTRADTTLVLCGTTFVATQAKCNVTTRRLLVYADTVILPGDVITGPGKEIHFHCNRLEWTDGQVLNVKGADGQAVATVGHGPESDGKPGGIVVLHVHDLPFGGQKTFWPADLKIDVSGGLPGEYRSSSTSNDRIVGNPGKAGEFHCLPLS